MKYPVYELKEQPIHGDFTKGRHYPCLKLTKHGNGGKRGFYWDDKGAVRMLTADCFRPEPLENSWTPPRPKVLLSSAPLSELASRWGVVDQTVNNWQTFGSNSYRPIRFHDALAGSKHPLCTEKLTGHDLTYFIQWRGFYIQEVSVRWDMQQFGDRLKRIAQLQPALFWDLWRGMIDNVKGASHG